MKKTTTAVVAFLCMSWLLPCQGLKAQAPDPGTDMTDRIVNPTLKVDGMDSYEGWTLEKVRADGAGNVFRAAWNAFECWHGQFDFYQDLEGLAPGIYQLRMKGFYRDKEREAGLKEHMEGTEAVRSYIYCESGVRSQKQYFPSVFIAQEWEPTADYHEVTYNDTKHKYVSGMQGAREAFDAGLYENAVENVFVGEDGRLRIGARSDLNQSYQPYSWTLFGDFRLTYVREIEDKDYALLCDDLADRILLEYAGVGYSGGMAIIKQVEEWYDSSNYGETKEEILSTRATLDEYLSILQLAGQAADSLSEIYLPKAYALVAEPGYPQETVDALQAVINSAMSYLDGGNTPEDTPVYAAELRAKTLELIGAMYRFRYDKPLTEEEKKNGVDYTWRVASPDFTEEGYDITDSKHQSAEGWVIENRKKNGKPGIGDFRLSNVGTFNCWNNWAGNSTDCAFMDVYQEFTGLPAGYYSLRALHATQNTILQQHLYMRTSYEQKNSALPEPNVWDNDNRDNSTWSPLSVDSIFVGTDGYLRIGMESHLTTPWPDGWFCFTQVRLTRFPTEETNPNEVIRRSLLARGDTLLQKDFLPIQKNWLKEAQNALQQADIVSAEDADAAFSAYNEVLDSCRNAADDFRVFLDGDYAFFTIYAENPNEILDPALVALSADLKKRCDDMLADPAFTIDQFGELKSLLGRYLTFGDKYVTAFDLISYSYAEVQKNAPAVLAAEIDALKSDVKNVDASIENLMQLLSWIAGYERVAVLFEDESYTQENIAATRAALTENAGALSADPASVAEKTKEVYALYRELTLTIDRPEGDVTEWIENPEIIQEGEKHEAPRGWSCMTKGAGNTNFTESTGNTALECWTTTPAMCRFDYNQTLRSLPAGLYRLTVEARDIQRNHPKEGQSMLYASTSEGWEDEVSLLSHPVVTGELVKNDTIWKDPEDHSQGYDKINQSQDIDNMTLDTYTLDNIMILNDGTDLTIGVRCRAKKSACWFYCDNFKLYMLARYTDGIEEIGSGAGADLFKAYARNGRIVVEGAEDYTIYSIDAFSAYDKDAQLVPGVYIVKAGDRQMKVVVD